MIINFLQMGKLRPREAESLAQRHTAGKWQSQDLNLSLLVTELQLLGTYSHLMTRRYPQVTQGGRLRVIPKPVQG